MTTTMGYEDAFCRECNHQTLVKNGGATKCDTCGDYTDPVEEARSDRLREAMRPHMGGKHVAVNWDHTEILYAAFDYDEFRRLSAAWHAEHPDGAAIHIRTPSAGQIGTSEEGRRVAVALWLCEVLVGDERAYGMRMYNECHTWHSKREESLFKDFALGKLKARAEALREAAVEAGNRINDADSEGIVATPTWWHGLWEGQKVARRLIEKLAQKAEADVAEALDPKKQEIF